MTVSEWWEIILILVNKQCLCVILNIVAILLFIDFLLLTIALLAFMEQSSYIVDEATGIVEVCIILEGTLETNVSLSLITLDMSATGTVSL